MKRDPFEERWRRKQQGRYGHDRAPERPKKRPRTLLEVAAKRLALTVSHESPTGGLLTGKRAGLEVVVRATLGSQQEWHATITGRGLPASLSLSAEGALAALRRTVAGDDVLTGDAAFDERVNLAGEPAEVLAVLDEVARRRVLELLPHRLSIRRGHLALTFTTPPGVPPAEGMGLELGIAAGLAKRMSLDAAGARERLIQNARRDPDPGARRASLLQLALGELGHETLARFGEGPLLEVLEAVPAPAKLHLVRALGAVGTFTAVKALLPLTSGVFVRANVKEEARRAVAAIEARSGQSRGGLSLADVQGGELTAWDPLEGALDLPDEG